MIGGSSTQASMPNCYSENLVFEAPWEASVFALAVQLSEKGLFTWVDWTKALGDEFRDEGSGKNDHYYHYWCNALQKILIESRVVSRKEVYDRTEAWREAYRRTPHGSPVE